MPESAEVRYLADYINKFCKNKKLQEIKILNGRYKKHGVPKNFNKLKRVLSLKLIEVYVKGKVLFFHFEQDWYIISKLGLTGWWYVNDDAPEWRKSRPNIKMSFGKDTLYYTDNLSYGTITITNDLELVQTELNKIAPDILNLKFQDISERINYLRENKNWKNKKIEDVIIDQKVLLSGIGNYLKAEVLYLSKISPFRKIKDVSDEEWKLLIKKAKLFIKKQQKILDNPDKYMDSWNVYQQKTDKLGNYVRTHKSKNGRTTHWVPNVQK
jgi:formamidopyrimidine-DNA glycosylase